MYTCKDEIIQMSPRRTTFWTLEDGDMNRLAVKGIRFSRPPERRGILRGFCASGSVRSYTVQASTLRDEAAFR